MKEQLDRGLAWLDNRTGLETAIREFLYEDIPASSGWHQVFGSVAMFLFMVQAFTGALLAFNYAPTPGEAYNSLHYILTEVTAGRLVRALHHWGASMMIVVVVLHMVQVFLFGSYKKPREATWVAGIILLLLTMAYGLTGYLLPWDNRAYWGTVVVTQIAAGIPLMGPYLSRLLGSSGDIGVVTFARFYGLHVLLLPPATTLMIVAHVYLVRKHGVAPVPGDEKLPSKKFYPRQVFLDTVAVFIAFTVLFALAVAARLPLERLANPSDTAYIPRPEWYFLFLFQILKFFNGPMEVVGTVVLPSLAILLLILTPLIDRAPLVRISKRVFAMAVVLFAGIGWGALTLAAVRGTPPPNAAAEIDYSGSTGWMQLPPAEMAGIGYFRQANCAQCHTVGEGRAKAGPTLGNVVTHKPADWLVNHFHRITKDALSDSQQSQLATFLTKLNPGDSEALRAAPDFAAHGAVLFQTNHCGSCHQVNGVGMKIGPVLNGLAARRTEEYVEEHFVNPQKMAPGTMMPPYHFPPNDMKAMISYLFTLPE
ncbi:MAG: Cytochrome b/b6, N-terminal domain [Bryobacterales bacterium]|nr:Cytochrome b/b6, N-terminal domain [Bryobacterales bacterium]